MINRLIIAVLCTFFCSCDNINRDKLVDKSALLGADYRLFQNTPAWELAKAVQDENENKINELVAKQPSLTNFQDPKYGNSLLMLTIMNQQIKPFKTLLDNKADVSIHNTYDGTSALIEACSFKEYDTKYAELLLKNGANINDIEVGKRREGNSTRFTPLLAASKTGKIELVELLVKNGADLNYKNEYNQSALSQALKVERYNIVSYLLNVGVDYSLPITYIKEQNKTYYLVDELRFYMPDLGSKEYKEKQELISLLRSKGIEYKNVPIPEYVRKTAQENYPNTWQEYLEKY